MRAVRANDVNQLPLRDAAGNSIIGRGATGATGCGMGRCGGSTGAGLVFAASNSRWSFLLFSSASRAFFNASSRARCKAASRSCAFCAACAASVFAAAVASRCDLYMLANTAAPRMAARTTTAAIICQRSVWRVSGCRMSSGGVLSCGPGSGVGFFVGSGSDAGSGAGPWSTTVSGAASTKSCCSRRRARIGSGSASTGNTA